jgi:hypothetical protein
MTHRMDRKIAVLPASLVPTIQFTPGVNDRKESAWAWKFSMWSYSITDTPYKNSGLGAGCTP